VVRERILGPSNMCTLKGLKECAEYFLGYLKAYEHGIDLLKYGLSLSPSFILYILDAFWVMYDENARRIRLSNVSHVLGVIAVELKERAWTSSDKHSPNNQWSNYDLLCLLSIYLLDLLCRVMSIEDEASSVRHLVDGLVRTRCRTADGRTLLHLAVHPECLFKDDHGKRSYRTRLPTMPPSSIVVGHLLEAGAAADTTDARENTPLHAVVFSQPETTPETDEIVNLLLQHGAHVDAANADGRTASDCLSHSLVFDHISLKCLAARAVRSFKLPYRGTVPTTLADFVDRH